MTAEDLKVAEWETNEHGWSLHHGGIELLIEKRPVYCDRGHWTGKAFGVPNVDEADRFPRYYMSLEIAKQEMRDWLVWRLYKETDRR